MSHPTLIHAIAAHGEARPAAPALTFLPNGEVPGPALTYAGLVAAVGQVAGQLAAHGLRPGDRAVLAYPPGLEFVVAFLGCLAAGVVAVPAAVPRHPRSVERLAVIGRQAGATAVLSTAAQLPALGLPGLATIATDASADGPGGLVLPGAADLAFLQYTSGSTSLPKGVEVTHASLMANEASLSAAFESHADSVMLSWLPLFHDMGLIGVVLHALAVGAQAILMSPLSFIQKPLRWPRAVTRFQATITGGPNFAFDLCTRRATPEAVAGLDLRSLEVLFSGAEPIHADTLERFAAAFAPAGFQRRMYYPCYGLAEATLFASGGALADEPALAPGARPVVGCGPARPGHQLLVVDPETRRPRPEGEEGEIWFKGPSVARGYWGLPEATRETFDAARADTGEAGFLRTGDLGFLRAGQLFVSGRLKDVIIVEGRNHYPQDLERTVESAHDVIRATTAIAFAVPNGAREEVVVVAELGRALAPAEEAAVREAVREAVAGGHDLALKELVLLRGQHVPKTTSGKIMRAACREAYMAGGFRAVEGATP